MTLAAADIAPLQAEENEWGEHPECPVEVLADGTQVWRVPPGTECGTVFGVNVTLNPSVPDDYVDRGASWLWVQQTDGQLRLLHWTELRRVDHAAPGRP